MDALHANGSQCNMMEDHRTRQETGLCEGGGGDREGGRQVRCQTAAVAAGQGLRAVTHAGTPCRSQTMGEGAACAGAQG